MSDTTIILEGHLVSMEWGVVPREVDGFWPGREFAGGTVRGSVTIALGDGQHAEIPVTSAQAEAWAAAFRGQANMAVRIEMSPICE